MKTTKQLLVAATAAVLTAGSASAVITVDTFSGWNGGSNMAELHLNFDVSGSDKLVIVVTGEHGFNQTANGAAGDVFYDGVMLTPVVKRQPIKAVADDINTPEDETVLVDDTYSGLYYLDNPGSVFTAGLITTTGFASRGNMAVMGLSGTAAGVGNSVVSDRDTNTADLTTSAGSIVIGSYNLGGTGNTAQLAPITTPSWDAEVARRENGNNWDGHVVAYDNDVAAGTATYTFDDSQAPLPDGRTGRHVILAEFLSAVVAIPGDTDGDGDLDDSDLGTSLSNYTGPVGDVGKTAAEGDTDGDGDVDDSDLGTSFSNYTGPLSPTAVPEPTSLALLGLGGLALARRRRA